MWPAFQARALRLHRDLLHLREHDPTLGMGAAATVRLAASPLNPRCVVLRYYFDDSRQETQENDRLLLVNLGPDFELERITEPLLAPPIEAGLDAWRTLWCSEAPSYGGHGCAEPCGAGNSWLVPAAAAVLLAPAFAVTKGTS